MKKIAIVYYPNGDSFNFTTDPNVADRTYKLVERIEASTDYLTVEYLEDGVKHTEQFVRMPYTIEKW